MNRVDGKSVWNLSAKLPSAVCRDVEKALTWLHAKDIVFGDLRDPNILYDRVFRTPRRDVVNQKRSDFYQSPDQLKHY